MRDTFYLPASVVAPGANCPVIAVKVGEVGYYPVFALVDFETLNGCEIPDDVLESALAGSMFGWDVEAAEAAIEFCRAELLKKLEAQGYAVEDLRPPIPKTSG